jgi:uncharacterized membrane protein YraQ (UPF0718 family)/copper chaperone CopZ
MNVITDYIQDFFNILNEMSPYLLLGFLFAGVLHVFFPKRRINGLLGGKNSRSVINAALLGVPLPLCSCGVIPTGISFYKNGASKGSSISFLISTPQTGIDSIMVTYSLLGLPFAIIRPVIALITGFFGGFLTNLTDKKKPEDKISNSLRTNNKQQKNTTSSHPVIEMLRYAFVDFLQDISKWLIIGLLIAAVISVIVPDDFFTEYLGNGYWDMLIILFVSIPIYVCATASVPIAAILILKGISPGAALVFLMAGPATNAATITIINKVLGKKTLIVYLFSIITGALFFGILLNTLLPHDLFIKGISMHSGTHEHEILPEWLKISSGVTLLLLIINGYIQKFLKKKSQIRNISSDNKLKNRIMKYITVKIKGMTCNHCKMSVENSLKNIEGIEQVNVDLAGSKAFIKGVNINLEEIKNSIEKLGYEYKGEIK